MDTTPGREGGGERKEACGIDGANYASVADFDAADNMVKQAIDELGLLDGVVNNAGIRRDVIFHKME